MEVRIIWLHFELLNLILNICRFAVGFARVLLENVNKRFPKCGTQVEERCVANLLDPHLKGVHLSPAGKLNSTKALVKTRWSHLEEARVVEEQEVEGVTPRPPLSPTSKLLKNAGGLVEEETTGVGRLSVELHRFEALQGGGPAPVVEDTRDEPADAGQDSEGDIRHPGILLQERESLLYQHQGD